MEASMIIGHERNIKYLERVISRETHAHAYLFAGPEGVGKRTIAIAAAASLLCERGERRIGGCEACESCRLVQSGAHPDLIILSQESPLVGESGERRSHDIGIDDILELRRRLGETAWRGGARVAIIDGAERMSRDAQPALLKLLEEPGLQTFFFIISARPGALLDTVRSRAVALNFSVLDDEEIAPLIVGMPKEEHDIVLAIAAGRPGVAALLARDSAALAAARAEHAKFEKLERSGLEAQFAFNEDVAKEDAAALGAWYQFLIRRGRTGLQDAIRRGDEAQARRSASLLRLILDRSARAEALPVNRRLVADEIAFNFSFASVITKSRV